MLPGQRLVFLSLSATLLRGMITEAAEICWVFLYLGNVELVELASQPSKKVKDIRSN